MKNTFTMYTAYETRTFTTEQFIEVLRDLLHVTGDVAKMMMHYMEEGKTYFAGTNFFVKNKAEA